MFRRYEHRREGTHIHHINWHISRWTHDPRFWAAVILLISIGLMLFLYFMAGETGGRQTFPTYPYVPY